MELIKQKDGLVSCLLFTSVLLPTVLAAVLSPTVLPNDIGETPEPEILHPCTYRGDDIPHGEEYIYNECITCVCNNLTVTCSVNSCFGERAFCGKPVKLDGVCCPRCNHYVPIYDVNVGNLTTIREEQINNITFNLNLKIDNRGVGVTGQGLWKLGIWGSGSADGEGKRISYQEQVLTEEQAAARLNIPNYYKRSEFNINNITYSLNGTGAPCSETEYLCYEFNKGDNPYLDEPRLSFTVKGVDEDNDTISRPENLRGCTRFSKCFKEHEGRLPCSYLGNIILHGEDFLASECTTVTCNNGAVQVAIRNCPTTFCAVPEKFEGECCKICPYYVPIYEVNAGILDVITEREVNDIVFDLTLMLSDHFGYTSSVTGRGLWKLGLCGSGRADGEGESISYQEQVLTEEQAATKLINPSYGESFDFNISNITFSLDGTDATCSEMEFLCYEFNKGDDPEIKDQRLSFTVEGVAGEDDLTVTPQNLRGCTRFSTCLTDKSVTENAVQACDNIPEGQEDDFLFDIRVAVRGAGINERGEKSWNVNVLGVNVVTSGDND